MRVSQDLVPYLSATPQPVALALGRVVRSGGRPERLEACLKAAEVLTRYLAVVSLASAAATRQPGQDFERAEDFDSNLAFGSFERVIRQSLAVEWAHPLRDSLRTAMRSTKKHTAVAGVRLERFVNLRNELGHALTHVDELRALSLFEEHDPVGGLKECLDGLEAVLSCPPLVVLNQEHRRGRLTAHVLFFVGESDPIPYEIDLLDPVYEWEKPYLCTADGLVPLPPGLTLRARPDGRRGLYLIDGIEPDALRYKGAYDNDILRVPGAQAELGRWFTNVTDLGVASHADVSPLIEIVRCSDGRDVHAFLRNDPAADQAAPATSAVATSDTSWTLSSFEQAIGNVGLGTAYRDIVYAMTGNGCRAEATDAGVRMVGGPDGARSLVLIELQGGPVLTVTMQLKAFPSAKEGTESVSLIPAQRADELVAHLNSLFEPV